MGFQARRKERFRLITWFNLFVPGTTVPLARGRLIWDILAIDLRSVDLYQDVN